MNSIRSFLWVIFIFLKVILTAADNGSSFIRENIMNPDKPRIFEKLLNDIASQARFTSIILITDEYYNIQEYMPLHVLPSKIDLDYLKNVYKELIKTSGKALYVLDTVSMSREHQKNLIEKIRLYDKTDPILIHGGYFIPNLTYNLYFVREIPDSGFDLYEICAYGKGGKDVISKFNSWSGQKGFQKKFTLSSSYKGSMNGYNLTLAANEILTLVNRKKDRYNNTIWEGREYWSLKLVGEIMNFEINVKASKTVSAIADGKATGVLGMVAYGEADIGAGALTTGLDREKYVDYSPSINDLSYVIVTDEPEKGVGLFTVIHPFRPVVWGFLFASVPVSAFVLSIIHKSSKKFREIETRKSYFWEVTKILLWDSTKVGSGAYGSTKVYLGMYMLATMILINIYLGVLTSFITVEPNKWPPIESLEDLQKSHLKWLIRDSSTFWDYFEGNEIMTRKRVNTNVDPLVEAMLVALQTIQDNPNTYAYIQDLTAVTQVIGIQHMDYEGNHGFHFGKHPVISNYNTFYLRKEAIYKKDFMLNIIKLTENGMIPQIYLREKNKFTAQMRKLAKQENRSPKEKSKEGVQMKHMTGSFMIITLCYCLSLVALTGEILWFNKCKNCSCRSPKFKCNGF